MSGGHYNYFYSKLHEFASWQSGQKSCPYRDAFRDLLTKCATAAHAIEWVDSCDYSEGDEIEPIKATLGDNWAGIVLSVEVNRAEKQIEKLRELIAKVQK